MPGEKVADPSVYRYKDTLKRKLAECVVLIWLHQCWIKIYVIKIDKKMYCSFAA